MSAFVRRLCHVVPTSLENTCAHRLLVQERSLAERKYQRCYLSTSCHSCRKFPKDPRCSEHACMCRSAWVTRRSDLWLSESRALDCWLIPLYAIRLLQHLAHAVWQQDKDVTCVCVSAREYCGSMQHRTKWKGYGFEMQWNFLARSEHAKKKHSQQQSAGLRQ